MTTYQKGVPCEADAIDVAKELIEEGIGFSYEFKGHLFSVVDSDQNVEQLDGIIREIEHRWGRFNRERSDNG